MTWLQSFWRECQIRQRLRTPLGCEAPNPPIRLRTMCAVLLAGRKGRVSDLCAATPTIAGANSSGPGAGGAGVVVYGRNIQRPPSRPAA